MRDSLTNPPTTVPHQGQNQPLRPCYVLLQAPPPSPNSYSQHVTNRNRRKSFHKNEIEISTRNSFLCLQSLSLTRLLPTLADGHARPSIPAVTPIPSPRLPKLMGTLSHRSGMPILTEHRDQSAASLPRFQPRNVLPPALATPQNLSAPLPRDFSRNSNPISKTAKISRHVFAPFHTQKSGHQGDSYRLGADTIRGTWTNGCRSEERRYIQT